MKLEVSGGKSRTEGRGLAVWLLERLRGAGRPAPRLAVLERITLAPRQSLALVEAEGRRFLVATSAEGTPAFYALDEPARRARTGPLVRLIPGAGCKAGNEAGTRVGHKAARQLSRSVTDHDARVSW